MTNLETIKEEVRRAAEELIDQARISAGQLVVVGCSSSEISGARIGQASSEEIGQAVFDTLNEVFSGKGIGLACQCCEHLNRALVLDKKFGAGLEAVNAVPQPKAGGSFATAAYRGFEHPVVVEEIAADAGLDIGQTLIGMHLRKVAVPVRLSVRRIGEANLTAARTRPKYIGGPRASYDTSLV